MRKGLIVLVVLAGILNCSNVFAAGRKTVDKRVKQEPNVQLDPIKVSKTEEEITAPVDPLDAGYIVGIDDVLSLSVLQPEKIETESTVSPDGAISFPYIGSLKVQGLTIQRIQEQLQSRLADGYLNYPSVVVVLKESRSRKFFVYGQVEKPGSYPLEDKTTVLRAISVAGGFTKWGSSSHVKVLRPKAEASGYENIKINIDQLMSGNSTEDMTLNSGDIVVVSEGIF